MTWSWNSTIAVWPGLGIPLSLHSRTLSTTTPATDGSGAPFARWTCPTQGSWACVVADDVVRLDFGRAKDAKRDLLAAKFIRIQQGLVGDLVARAIRSNRFARIIRNWNPSLYSASGRFARTTRITPLRLGIGMSYAHASDVSKFNKGFWHAAQSRLVWLNLVHSADCSGNENPMSVTNIRMSRSLAMASWPFRCMYFQWQQKWLLGCVVIALGPLGWMDHCDL